MLYNSLLSTWRLVNPMTLIAIIGPIYQNNLASQQILLSIKQISDKAEGSIREWLHNYFDYRFPTFNI